jgi:hypothetical protein
MFQDGDTVAVFKNTKETKDEIRNPHTTARLTSESSVEPPKKSKDKPRVQKDWIRELM